MAGKKKKYRGFWIFVKIQLLLFLLVAGGLAYYFLGGYGKQVNAMRTEAAAFVRHSSEETFKNSQPSLFYAADGTVISMLKDAKESYYVSIDEIPQLVVDAMVSIEDKKFYSHDGVDYQAILRAAKAAVEDGEVTQGGSTITMQLARNIFLTQERTWQRKAEEIFIAWDLEKKYSKDQIMEFYLNNIYFGNGYYGILSASRGYFNCGLQELSLSQIAFLCGIPNSPTLYDPVTNMENAIGRRDRILENMLADEKITRQAYDAACAEEIVLERPTVYAKNNYVETYVYFCATEALMEQEGFEFLYTFSDDAAEEAYNSSYGEAYARCQKELYTKGYQVYTTMDISMQQKLQEAVDEALSGYTEVNEEGVYTLQSAAVCIDNANGYVKAIVGGRDQELPGYTLNRGYQSYRQPGSTIKPLIVYTPSFERNYTPDSVVVDEPVEDGPSNASGSYQGEVTLRHAVESSINVVAWKLFDELTPEVGLSYLQAMNFGKLDEEDYRLTSALGGLTYGTSPLEMAAAYATLENDGRYRKPTCISRILDAQGNVVYASLQEEKEVYKQNAAREMTDVLTGVLTVGTAKGMGLSDMPSAGKTGTTNELKDGWFVGYTRYYTTSVWVGYDMPKEMAGLAGNTYPVQIWHNFMTEIHEGLEPLEFLPSASISNEYINGQEEKQKEEEDKKDEVLERQQQRENGAEAEAQPEAENGAEAEAQPENGADAGAQTEPQQTPEVEAQPEAENGAEAEVQPEAENGAEVN
jgi:1A family penicillin-binding protein